MLHLVIFHSTPKALLLQSSLCKASGNKISYADFHIVSFLHKSHVSNIREQHHLTVLRESGFNEGFLKRIARIILPDNEEYWNLEVGQYILTIFSVKHTQLCCNCSLHTHVQALFTELLDFELH